MSELKHEPAQVCMKPRRPSLEERLYDFLGSDWCGNTCPPGNNLMLAIDDDYIAEIHNDGFEFWIGTRSEWRWHCRAKEARRIAWFVLWTWWAKGTWFGLRTWAWYKLLSRRVRRYQQPEGGECVPASRKHRKKSDDR